MFRTSYGQKVKHYVTPTLAPLLLLLGGTLVLASCGEAKPHKAATQVSNEATVRSEASADTKVQAQTQVQAQSKTKTKAETALRAGDQSARGPATVLVLGDSISAAYGIQREKGWATLLQHYVRRIDEEFTVVNASISGETTGGGLARFAQSLAEHQPKITIIELGGNDGLRGYPLQQVKSNLNELVQMAKAANSKVLLLGMQIPPNYGARYSNGFAELFNDIARTEQVSLVPSFLERIALTPGMLQADGIHPVQQAQPLLLETVKPELDKLLSRLTP